MERLVVFVLKGEIRCDFALHKSALRLGQPHFYCEECANDQDE